jgi:integrase
MKFTQKAVSLIAPGERRIVWDDDAKGLGIRVTEGAVSYIVDFRIGGQRRRVVIGSTRDWKLEEARDRAAELVLGGRKGVDLSKGEYDGQPTFGEMWERRMNEVDRLKCAPATVEDYQDRYDRLIAPKLAKKRVGDVNEADVERVVAATKGDRNRQYVVALIKKTVNYAIKSRTLPRTHINPATEIKIKKLPPKGKALETDEIALFGAALQRLEERKKVSPWLANLFRLALICGLRPGEVRTLKWERVNIPKRTLEVVGKTGSRTVHLADAALQVLAAIPRVQGNPYVFVGRRHGEPLVGIHKQLCAIQAEAGVDHFRPYDLRHSAATGALSAGADIRAVQALLGHADLATTSIYLHASASRRKAAAERASAFGVGVLKNEP